MRLVKQLSTDKISHIFVGLSRHDSVRHSHEKTDSGESLGYSVSDITKHLNEENISISRQAILSDNIGKLVDLPRGARDRKLTEPMIHVLNEALMENDDRQARSLLTDKWPDLQVSIPTIKCHR